MTLSTHIAMLWFAVICLTFTVAIIIDIYERNRKK